MAKAVLVSISLVLVAIYLSYRKNHFQADLRSILDGLLYQERRYNVNKENRVAVGFGSCWDVVSNGVDVMKTMGMVPPENTQHFDTISNAEELSRSFAYFFQKGAAGE